MIVKTTYYCAACDCCGGRFVSAPPTLEGLEQALREAGWCVLASSCVCGLCMGSYEKVLKTLRPGGSPSGR